MGIPPQKVSTFAHNTLFASSFVCFFPCFSSIVQSIPKKRMEDLESVQGQTGTAVLDLEGKVVKASGSTLFFRRFVLFVLIAFIHWMFLILHIILYVFFISGDLAASQDGSANILLCLFRIIEDASKCIEDEGLNRITVSYADCNYIITATDKNIYIVKALAS